MNRFMFRNYLHRGGLLAALIFALLDTSFAQFGQQVQWSEDGNAILKVVAGEIVQEAVADPAQLTVVATKADLTPSDSSKPLAVRRFSLAAGGDKILINTNTARVWRYDTRGDYWVFDTAGKSLTQLGKTLPESSLMYAKLSPDGTQAAYVSGHNLYVEELGSGTIKPLTTDSTDRIIHG